MTYTFKLSSRLAHLWAPVCAVTLVVSACTDGDMSSMSPFDQLGNGGSPAAVSSRVSPKAAVIETSRTVKFSADSGMTWSSSGGKITSDGTFSSTISGSFLVVGRGKNRTDSAKVTVVNPNQRRLLTISPREVQLAVGQSAAFSSSATLPNGTPTTMAETWSTTGGTVDKDGNYIAGDTPGTYAVIVAAPSDGLADTAVVTVTALSRRIVQLVLAPAVAVVVVDGSLQFTTTARYEDGSVGPASASYAVSGGGKIDDSGRFVAGTAPGLYEVTATAQSSIRASAQVEIRDSQAVASAAASPTDHPNEPATYTPLGDVGFDKLTLSPDCPNSHKGPAGCWWRYGALQSVTSDPTSPEFGSVLDLTFPAGLEPGYGQNKFGGWAVGGPIEYREIYESGWVKIPSPDFETQMACVKLFGYWGVGERRADMNPIQIAMEIPGNGQATSLMSAWNIMFVQQNVLSRRLNQNLRLDKKLTAGSWHHYEVQMAVNDIGRANGVLRTWLDGVQILSYTDVTYRDSNNTAGFFGRKWDPIWGCQGGQAKSRDDHLWISQVYLSGIRM